MFRFTNQGELNTLISQTFYTLFVVPIVRRNVQAALAVG